MKLSVGPRSGICVVAAMALFAAAPARAQQAYTAKAGALTLTLTIPEGLTKLRGVLAFTATGLGPRMATGADFQALAKRLSAGIVRVQGANEFGDASYPTRCARGEFKWMLDAIAMLAKASNHPEITHAPIVGHGHSHGGDYWNYFNACYPERMALVFCKASGGVQYSKGALKTPMIWETGTNDLRDSRGVFRGAMMAHRELGTQMALVIGPGETHGGFTPESRQLVIDLIEGIFNLRVPAEVDTANGPLTLFDIDEASGKFWLGDNYTKAIAPYAELPGKDVLSRTSFLPSEEVAKKWKAYGALLPEAVKIERGRCTTCYKPLATEPEARPNNAGPAPGPAPTPADAGVEEAAPPPPAPTGPADAAPPPPPPAPSPPAPPPSAPPAAPTPSAPAPAPAAAGSDTVAGGCAFGRGGRAPLWLLLALGAAAVLRARRRQ